VRRELRARRRQLNPAVLDRQFRVGLDIEGVDEHALEGGSVETEQFRHELMIAHGSVPAGVVRLASMPCSCMGSLRSPKERYKPDPSGGNTDRMPAPLPVIVVGD
jgi:hypothetical protein